MQIEVRHLRIVEAIDRLGSMTRAAAALHLSQPAVSHTLRELERRVGVCLFQRKGRGLEITAAGRQFAARARSILGQLMEAEAELRQMDGGERGVLRLATECYTCYHWLPEALERLQKALPGLQLELVADVTRHPIPAVVEGKADVAIVHSAVDDPRLETLPLFSDEVVAAVHPQHPLAGRPYITAQDLEDQHLVLHFGPESSVAFTELLDPAGLKPARCSELYLTEAIVETVKAGLGVSTLARWAISPHLEAGTLCAVPLTESGLFRQWSACFLRSNRGSAGIDTLVRLIRERGLALSRSRVATA